MMAVLTFRSLVLHAHTSGRLPRPAGLETRLQPEKAIRQPRLKCGVSPCQVSFDGRCNFLVRRKVAPNATRYCWR